MQFRVYYQKKDFLKKLIIGVSCSYQVFYLPLGKGSGIEVTAGSVRQKSNKRPPYQEKSVGLIKRSVQNTLESFPEAQTTNAESSSSVLKSSLFS